MPPGLPKALPFKCNPQNTEKMRQWLLERYKSSTFNTCPRQILPDMEGPPISIHVDLQAIPVAVHVPSQIPLHWQEKVKSDLRRDESLGLSKGSLMAKPPLRAIAWLSPIKLMENLGRPWIYPPLDKHSVREVHATRSSFELAKGVPERTWKTVTDGWNGFHSVPYRHLTTFITPWDRFPYKRAPQGFGPSGLQ